MILGLFYATIVSILFALYAVPRKYSKQNVILYTMWMGIAYFLCTIILLAIVWGFELREREDLFSSWHLVTVARGLVWVLGMVAYNLAIDKIGLARFNQWKNIQGPVGSLLMLFFLAEVVGNKAFWLLLGMTAMFASAFLFQVKKDDCGKSDSFQGVTCAVFAGVCFGVTALLNKIVSDQGFLFAQLIYHSASIALFSAIIYLVIERAKPVRERIKNLVHLEKSVCLPFMSGGMFLLATVLMILSYGLIASPIVWSITQLNAAWTILIGVFVFKEIEVKSHWQRIAAGFFLAFVAILFLFMAL